MSKRTFRWMPSLITKVTDGDTLRVDALWEMPVYIRPLACPIALRIGGIDCWPEDDTEHHGRDAAEETAEQCLGRTLVVVTYEFYAYRGPEGTLGEWVGDVELNHTIIDGGERLLSKHLLSLGYAVPYDGKGKRPSARVR